MQGHPDESPAAPPPGALPPVPPGTQPGGEAPGSQPPRTPGPEVPSQPGPAASGRHARTRWLVPVIAGVVAVPLLCFGGFAAGTAASGDVEPEIVVETETVTETVRVDPSEEREADLDEREQTLDERAEELDEREAELQEWEETLAATEAEIEAGTIPGDGIWVVGEDIEPGVYQAQGSGSSCYWARLRSLDGSDIISNHFGSASVSLEIHASDAAFETSGCGSWQLR